MPIPTLSPFVEQCMKARKKTRAKNLTEMQFLTIFRSFLRREVEYAQRNLKANSRNPEFPNVDGTARGNFQYYGRFNGVRELVTGRKCDINDAGQDCLLLGWDTYQSLYGFAGPGSTTYNCDLFWFRWFGYLPPMAHATTVDEATGQVLHRGKTASDTPEFWMMALEKLVDCPFSLMPSCQVSLRAMSLTLDAVVCVNLQNRFSVREPGGSDNRRQQFAIVVPAEWEQRLTAPYNMLKFTLEKYNGFKDKWYDGSLYDITYIAAEMALPYSVSHIARDKLHLGELAGVDAPGLDDEESGPNNARQVASPTRPTNGIPVEEDHFTIPGPWEIAATPSTWGGWGPVRLQHPDPTQPWTDNRGWGSGAPTVAPSNRGWGSGAPTVAPSNVGWGSSTVETADGNSHDL